MGDRDTSAPEQGWRLPEWAVRTLGVITILVGAGYLFWRAGWTLNPEAWWLSLPLFVAEVHAYGVFVLYLFMTWHQEPVKPRGMQGDPSVDLFICTYNEPPQVLALTIAGAVEVRGDHETYVLDDGRREWVRELCASFGAKYLTRPDNAGAKAGNINHALQHTDGAFIGILDADHVPSPDFIEQLLPYFGDEALALVQGPQEYYNLDSFQHTGDGSDWHEQATFYRVIQPGKNRWNAAFWCGSPSLVRRTALESVGGVATETITEDLHTSLRLHREGWKTLYHNEIVARGVAPDDFDGFVLQRFRWARGAMQVIRREFWRGGLTSSQRLNYMGSTGTYFDSYRKLIFLLVVPAVLLSGQLPIAGPLWIFLAAWAGYFTISQVANIAVGRGYYRWLWVEMFDLLKLPAFLVASATLVIGGKANFKVTPKGEPGERRIHPMVLPYIVLMGIYVAALVVGGLRLGGVLPVHNTGALIAAAGWATVIMALLSYLQWRAYRHISRRSAPRLAFRMAIDVTSRGRSLGDVAMVNATLHGAAFTTTNPVSVGQELMFEDPSDVGIHSAALVRSVAPLGGQTIVGVEFVGSHLERCNLARSLARGLFDVPGVSQPVALREPERLAA